MKKITFFGSGIESADVKIRGIEVDSVVFLVSKKFDMLKFGGTNEGLMGQFSKSADNAKMKIECILPKYISDNYPKIIYEGGEKKIVETMADRKKELTNTDAILCYPGGIGTFDELFDTLVKISFGEIKPIPIIIYNFERLFSPLLLQIELCINKGLIKKNVLDNLYTFEHVDQLSDILNKIN